MKEIDLDIFPGIDKSEWSQLAQNQLKGADPYETLNWESHGLSNIEPYYDSSDTESLAYLSEFFSRVKPHRWKLYQSINVEKEEVANKQALDALSGGCDGVMFELTGHHSITSIVKDIDLSICDVSIFSQGQTSDLPAPLAMINSSGAGNVLKQEKKYDSPIAQLSDIIDNIKDHTYVYRKSFSDFFLEIATLRALRFLLDRQKNLQGIHIHSSVALHESDEHQWFLNTTAGLASILGGSHSIDMPTQIGDSRITRNVGNLIRDESQINEYTDQCGGSYFVEVLTDRIIQSVKSN